MRFLFSVRSNVALLSFAAALASSVVGCGFGGLHDDLETVGDQPGGVAVALGDIAVSPDGKFIVFMQDSSLAVGWVDSGEVEKLPVENPSRVAFSRTRNVIYATTEDGTIHSVNVESGVTYWKADVEVPSGSLDWMIVASKDDKRVAIASGDQVHVYHAKRGMKIVEHALESPVIDLEILPDGDRLLVVEEETWDTSGEVATPSARIDVVALGDGAVTSFEVPNCADDIIVPKGGNMALLAPTHCAADPISHIDLTPGEEKFVRNLPGFGPVAMSPDGATAVGFLDMQALDETLFDDPETIPPNDTRYHLMIIDTEELTYEFAPFGQNIPRYAPTPNGEALIVDDFSAGEASIFDVATRTFRPVEGVATVDALSFSSDSKAAYVLSKPELHGEAEVSGESEDGEGEVWLDFSLFHLDVEEAKAVSLPTTFRPRNINISPDDTRLFLRESATEICVYSLADQACERTIVIGPLVDGL